MKELNDYNQLENYNSKFGTQRPQVQILLHQVYGKSAGIL